MESCCQGAAVGWMSLDSSCVVVMQGTKRMLFSREQQNERQKLEMAIVSGVVCGGSSLQSVEDFECHATAIPRQPTPPICCV